MKTAESIFVGDVAIPLRDYVVDRNAILGIPKSGKTYTAPPLPEIRDPENERRIMAEAMARGLI